MKIYLDVCCLSRPFDDQTQHKVRLETQAILFLLAKCRRGEFELVGSEVIYFEADQISSEEKRREVHLLADLAAAKVIVNEELEKRAEELRKFLKIGFYDALHLACSEKGKASHFFTTDEKLLKKGKKRGKILTVEIVHPVEWLIFQGGFQL